MCRLWTVPPRRATATESWISGKLRKIMRIGRDALWAARGLMAAGVNESAIKRRVGGFLSCRSQKLFAQPTKRGAEPSISIDVTCLRGKYPRNTDKAPVDSRIPDRPTFLHQLPNLHSNLLTHLESCFHDVWARVDSRTFELTALGWVHCISSMP